MDGPGDVAAEPRLLPFTRRDDFQVPTSLRSGQMPSGIQVLEFEILDVLPLPVCTVDVQPRHGDFVRRRIPYSEQNRLFVVVQLQRPPLVGILQVADKF